MTQPTTPPQTNNAPLATTAEPKRALTAAESYRNLVSNVASSFLGELVGKERAEQATGRLSVALRQLGITTPALYSCTKESIGQSIAMCALTGLMPGGAYPGCYLIPRKQRVNVGGQWVEQQRMNWQMSWRGMVTLAKRAGWDVRCYAVHKQEPFEIVYDPSPRISYKPNPDTSVIVWEDLRGCVVTACPHADRNRVEALFVPVAVIEERRAASDTYSTSESKFQEWRKNGGNGRAPTLSVWHQWPIEMAMKAAIRYAVSRGLVPLDDDWQIAEQKDIESDIVRPHVDDVQASAEVHSSSPGLGMSGLESALAEMSEADIPTVE